MGNLTPKRMDTLKAAIESSRNRPDQLYAKAFLYFQAIFRHTEGDVSQIQLISYLPEEAYGSRQALDCLITGALVAMFAHRVKNTADWSKVSTQEILTYPAIMPPALVQQLDTIILEQIKLMGADLLASDLVLIRILAWQRDDYSKTKRWLRALDKATRIHQRMASVPLTDPFLREVKQKALEELRPAMERLQKKFQAQHALPVRDEIIKAFEREADNPNLPWLSDPHNLSRWLDFCRSDPFAFLKSPPAQLFDAFAAFVSRHEVSYTRQKYSSKK